MGMGGTSKVDRYVIDQTKCAHCGECAEGCPNDAVLDNQGTYLIICDTCIQCGTCVALCPVDAIDLVEDKPIEELHDAARAAQRKALDTTKSPA